MRDDLGLHIRQIQSSSFRFHEPTHLKMANFCLKKLMPESNRLIILNSLALLAPQIQTYSVSLTFPARLPWQQHDARATRNSMMRKDKSVSSESGGHRKTKQSSMHRCKRPISMVSTAGTNRPIGRYLTTGACRAETNHSSSIAPSFRSARICIRA